MYGSSALEALTWERWDNMSVQSVQHHFYFLSSRAFFGVLVYLYAFHAHKGPVASVFWLDDALESALRLDGIITLVDAKNIRRQLQRMSAEDRREAGEGDGTAERQQQGGGHQNEAAVQLAYADRILVNKVGRNVRPVSIEGRAYSHASAPTAASDRKDEMQHFEHLRGDEYC